MAGLSILVFAEHRAGKLVRESSETLGTAFALAKSKGAEVTALCIGKNIESAVEEIKSLGPAKVFVADHANLQHFVNDSYGAIFHSVIDQEKPGVVLAGGTMTGRQLMARVAALCDTGLAADCVAIGWDGDRLKMTRPVYGGTAMATLRIPKKNPQMATIRPKVTQPPQANPSASCEIVKIDLKEEHITSKIKVTEQATDEGGNLNLAAADIIVSGGRGLKEADNFKIVRELAEVLGAAVGASRAVVDAGWIPYAHQVGQTGKTVSPKLYIACGISGAIQHLIGMRTSETIVAINKDPDAPIFGVASVGLVGDALEIVPLLTKRLKK